MIRRRLSFISAVVALLMPITAGTQALRTSAAVTLTEGAVFLNDQPITVDAAPSDLPATSVIRTTDGRAAIALKRGGWLFLDAGASVRVIANEAYNFNRIEVLTGSAIVASATSAPVVDCESAVKLSDAGFARFDAQPVDARGERPCQVRIYEGAAAVPLASVTVALRSGQTMKCNKKCGDMIPWHVFTPGEPDAFEQWARRTHEQLKR